MGQGVLARQARLDAMELRIPIMSAQILEHPTDVQAMTERGFAYVRLGNNARAVADFEAAVKADPVQPYTWYYLCLGRLCVNDVAGYRKSAQEFLDRFGSSESRQISGRVAIACTLGNPPVGDISRIRRIADSATTLDNGRPAAKWFLLGKVLAQYRDGDYPAAQQTLLRTRGVTGVFAPANVDLLSAMAQFRAGGNSAAARESYRLAVARINAELTRVDAMPNAINVTDFMMCQVLKREADAMLGMRSTTQSASAFKVGSDQR
jgi:tetratricopeptide (TPR) repeat protein